MDDKEMFDTIMRELNNQIICDIDGREEQESFSFPEEADSDDIPSSLLCYYEASKSRAAVCEKLILEDLEDSPPSHHTEDMMNFPSELKEDMMTLNEQVICDEENNPSTDTCRLFSPKETAALFTDIVSACPNNKDEYLEVEKQLVLEYEAEREKLHCEEMKKEEQRRQRETDFQEELQRIMEAEKLHQKELELMGRRAQEKLEQELLLQQEVISNLQRRVEEERKMREEEQRRIKDEEDKRRREEEKIKMEAERKRMEEERKIEDMKRKKEEEEKRRMEREERRMREEEQRRMKEKEDERRREEEKIKMEANRKRMEEEMRREKEEEKKIEEMKLQKEEEKKREEEQRRMKEEEDKKKEEEKIKMESERRRMEEERKIEQMKLKKEEEEKRRIEREEKRKREEEQRRMKDEEDKRKREEEKLKVETERRRMEKEMRRKKEEERQKEELERKNEEEEKRRMEMEEKKKMREEETLKIEAQRKRMEEERKKEEMTCKNEEEEKRKREEERNKIILEKKKLEDEIRMMKEEEERMKKEEEERIKREEEEKRKKEEERNKIKEARKKMERKKRKLEEEMSLKTKKGEEIMRKEEEMGIMKETEENQEETRKKSREKETLKKTHKEMRRRDERENGDVDEELKPEERKEVKEVVRTKEEENRQTKEESRPMEADERRKTEGERKTKEEERRRRQVEELRQEDEEGYRKSEEETKLKESKEGCVGEKLEKEEEKKRMQEEIRKREGAEMELKEEEVKENKKEVNKKTEEGGRLKEEESKTRMEQEKEVRVEDELQEKREESSLMGESKKKNKAKTENTSASQPEDGTTWTSLGSDPLHSESTTSPTSAKTRPPQHDPEENISHTSTDQTVDCEEIPAPSTVSVILPVCLPEHTERKRLSWMRDCVPWSKLSLRNRRKQKGSVRSRRGPRGAAEAGSLPPLCPDSLLQSAGWKSLQEVTTVTLEDLPGCNLSTLAQCTQLRSLTLRRCGLRSLDSIKQLPQLSYIDVQENDISFIDCENMTSLRVLHLSHNKLTSIHGLTGAENLDVLDLSHNSITRIAGLESVRRLQRLSVDHNQLISTKGLRDVYTLLHLNLSHNHLAGVEGLENSALLQTLDLRANSLMEPPTLNNQVLLRELHLDDNSISSLQGLTACWLPLMQNLSVAQNRITQLPSMSDSVSLANLDLRFNCMSEIQNVCESLEGCQFLREVHLTGNPLQQERSWRSTLQKAVPSLRLIDDQQTDSGLAPPTVKQVSSASGSFLMFCQAQLQQTHDLQRRHSRELSDASSSLDALKASCRHFTEALQLAEDQRFAQEYGEMTVTSSNPDMVPESNHQDLDLQNTAAVMIQQLWRKYRQKCGNSSSSSTAEKGGGRGGDGGKPESGPSYINGSVVGKDYAATVIQAFWRGFTLRRRLASALAAVTCSDSGEDDTFEEVDVDKFVFDEAALEKQWTLSLSEDSPPRRYPVSEQPLSLKPLMHFPEPSQYILPPPAVWRPMQAWVSGEQVDPAGRRVSPESSNRSKSPASASVLSGLSERSGKILEEWGFTDNNTALLMLKRAQKMKPSKQKRRRDPSVRLAMFRNCNYQLGPVEARNRPTQHNRNYIKVGEAEPGLQQAEKVERVKQERAQQWLHNQAAHSDRDSESEHFLPEISSDILNGGRVQLVADPGYTERLHHARGLWANNSLAAQPRKENNYPRRNSLGRAREEVPSPQRVTSAPSKKERISFRDNPVQLSGGWGGGKKRDKVYK